jgi:hypothetical protein
MWADFATVHALIESGRMCHVIAQQFLQEEPQLLKRQTAQ